MADQDANGTEATSATQPPFGRLGSLIARAAGEAPARGLPPVHLWNPPDCGDIGLEIRRDGSWWHEGTRFTRPALARLFSSLLRADEDGSVWVVTPHEKVRVRVEDLPLLAVRVDVEGSKGPGQRLIFTTNQDDVVIAGPDYPLVVDIDPVSGAPRPKVRVRGRLDARLTRAVFMELAVQAEVAGDGQAGVMGVWSDGVFFVLGLAE